MRMLTTLFISTAISLTGCSFLPKDIWKEKAKVFNKEACVNLGENGWRCQQTLQVKPRNMTPTEGAAWSFGKVCMDTRAFTDTENVIDELCENYIACDYVVREDLKKVFARGRNLRHLALDAIARAKKPKQ